MARVLLLLTLLLLPAVILADASSDDFSIIITILGPPTDLDLSLTAESDVQITWTKNDNCETTYIRRKQDGYPTTISDGDLIYNSTGDSYLDELVTVGNHYYYKAWSYNVTLNQYSEEYDEDHILVVVTPALFDIRDISVLDSVIPGLDIIVIVENEGDTEADITMTWYLNRTDNGVTLDSGQDTFAVSGGSERIYRIYPETTYVGEVSIFFGGNNASATHTFSTSETVSGGGGGSGGGSPSPSAVDTDGDGLTDAQESFYGTDPTEKDTDHDGYDDYQEIQRGTDPLNPNDYPGKAEFGVIFIFVIIGLLIFALFFLLFVVYNKKERTKARIIHIFSH